MDSPMFEGNVKSIITPGFPTRRATPVCGAQLAAAWRCERRFLLAMGEEVIQTHSILRLQDECNKAVTGLDFI